MMIDEKLFLQVFVSIVVGGYTLNKIIWETYKTFVKQRTRKGLLKLNWTLRPSSISHRHRYSIISRNEIKSKDVDRP
jgi:hypothetical protein